MLKAFINSFLFDITPIRRLVYYFVLLTTARGFIYPFIGHKACFTNKHFNVLLVKYPFLFLYKDNPNDSKWRELLNTLAFIPVGLKNVTINSYAGQPNWFGRIVLNRLLQAFEPLQIVCTSYAYRPDASTFDELELDTKVMPTDSFLLENQVIYHFTYNGLYVGEWQTLINNILYFGMYSFVPSDKDLDILGYDNKHCYAIGLNKGSDKAFARTHRGIMTLSIGDYIDFGCKDSIFNYPIDIHRLLDYLVNSCRLSVFLVNDRLAKLSKDEHTNRWCVEYLDTDKRVKLLIGKAGAINKYEDCTYIHSLKGLREYHTYASIKLEDDEYTEETLIKDIFNGNEALFKELCVDESRVYGEGDIDSVVDVATESTKQRETIKVYSIGEYHIPNFSKLPVRVLNVNHLISAATIGCMGLD